MKVGDLVRFTAPAIFSGAERDYAKSGIVTEVLVRDIFHDKKLVARVYWSDGRQTTEHFCYLRRIK